MTRRGILIGLLGTLLGLMPFATGLVVGGAAVLAAPTCQAAGTSGLTAVVVATNGQVIGGTIHATGCDVGVYVGPGVTGVLIQGATIENANDQGILVQDTTDVRIFNNTLSGNSVNPHKDIAAQKAITLVGTSRVIVSGNTVANNHAGGIAIGDDGTVNPGGLNPGQSRPGSFNVVTGNRITDNVADCAIVVAAYNPGQGVSHNLIAGNTISGNAAGIVIAADAPGTTASGNVVSVNSVTDNHIPGIILHSNAPGDVVTGTLVIGNRVSGNGADSDADVSKTTGIAVLGTTFGPSTTPAVVTQTAIIGNLITNEEYGIAKVNAGQTLILEDGLNQATTPVFTAP